MVRAGNAAPGTWWRRVLRGLRWPLAIVAGLIVALAVGNGFHARGKPDLGPWHRLDLAHELPAAQLRDLDWDGYVANEDALFAELDAALAAQPTSGAYRWQTGSRLRIPPGARDWNRSFAGRPPHVAPCGALLLHGLSDSPYSMRALAEHYLDKGCVVLVPRLPGHGTVPSGLLDAQWQDWLAVVELSMRHLDAAVDPRGWTHIVGYSNGGALALKYALEAIDRPEDPRVAKVILMSPMVGVTPAARLAWWISLLGHVPYFEKAKWIDVLPEYNPYKYVSFAANAGNQTSRVTRALYADLDRLGAAGKLGQLPPILTFQSIVDATVSAPAIVFSLYEKLPANGSELVLFDVNHLSGVDEFVQPDDRTLAERFLSASARPYRRVVVTNASSDTREVEARIVEAGATALTKQPLALSWPADVFSLTHIAVPFTVDDPLYGLIAPTAPSAIVPLGRLSPRGEKGVLTLATDALMRLSSNPFFPFVADRIGQWLGPAATTP